MSAAPKILLTTEEYLRQERGAEYRTEYLHGEVFAMAGANRRHNVIAGNIFAYLHAQLKGAPCQAYQSDMRVSPNANGYFYPDVVVACNKIHFLDEKEDTLLNPIVIVEVLSKSTASFDRGDKFIEYRSIKSLRDYLLISQEKAMVEHHTRQADGWLLQERKQLSDQIQLASLNLSLGLDVIYEGVEFPEAK
jgi:Uma2 family endonuclease